MQDVDHSSAALGDTSVSTTRTCRKAALTCNKSFFSLKFCWTKLLRSGLSYQRSFFALSIGKRRYCWALLSGDVPATGSVARPSAGTCKFCRSLYTPCHGLLVNAWTSTWWCMLHEKAFRHQLARCSHFFTWQPRLIAHLQYC